MKKAFHTRLIPDAFVILLFEHLEQCGEQPERILGIPRPSINHEQLSGIDIRQWEEMLLAAAEHMEDPLLGLKLGQMVEPRHLGVVGHMLHSCENFGVVLKRLEEFQRLIFDVIPMHRRERQGVIEMVWDISEFRTSVLVGEAGFATMVQFCRSVIDGEAQPLAIEFAHPSMTDDIRPYEEFFRCPVKFNCPEPFIRLSPELLGMPLKQSDSILKEVLEQHAKKMLAALPKQEEVVVQVRNTLVKLLNNGEPDIEQVSTHINKTARTLQRHLKDAGTSFRNELNLVRLELARSYLQDPRLQVSEIALLLGYSEHSAFTRAFKKYTGKSPVEARKLAIVSQQNAGTHRSGFGY